MVDLAAVIAQVESDNWQFAVRFEPVLYADWDLPTVAQIAVRTYIAQINECSVATAQMIACTSWGAHQILGESLYDGASPLSISIGCFMADRSSQDAAFARFLRAKNLTVSADLLFNNSAAALNNRLYFAQRYNGPASPSDYSTKMLAAYKDLVSGAG